MSQAGSPPPSYTPPWDASCERSGEREQLQLLNIIEGMRQQPSFQSKQDVQTGPPTPAYNATAYPPVLSGEQYRPSSPTPSELAEINAPNPGIASLFQKPLTGKKIAGIAAVALLGILVVVFLIFHKQLVDLLTPAANTVHKCVPRPRVARHRSVCSLKFGWLIPIGVLWILSFPPLGGHELVILLVGLTWGIGEGFAIAAAGTLIGEITTFYLFRTCCAGRARKSQQSSMYFACLVAVIQERGFKVIVAIRLSVIPSHFTTAVISTCGVGIFTFLLAAVLSLPKQFIGVVLGSLLRTQDDSTGAGDKRQRIATIAVILAQVLVAVATLRYINEQIKRVKPVVVRASRQKRPVGGEILA